MKTEAVEMPPRVPTKEQVAQGERIKWCMERAGVTVEDAMRVTGKSRATVYNWRSGVTEIDSTDRVKLAALCKLDRVGDLSPIEFDPPWKNFQES